ncbi:MAG: hypothetical protein HPY57_13945 [Ignavibacteria bacterium]|nr:hypothetical protein [Ignavibacteria bacterium]
MEKLNKEIENSEITNTIDNIQSDNLNCTLTFINDLIEEDIVILNNIVANHDGEPIFNKKYKIYELIFDKSYDPYLPPHEIDFSILGLFRVPFVENGELKKVVYYKTMTLVNGTKVFSEPVVEKNLEYIKVNGYYFSRKTDIYWYFEDGEIDNVWKKQTILYYTNDESIKAGNKRREYAVKNVQIDVVGLIQMTHVADSGITSTGSSENILIDNTKIFTEDYIGRTIEINNNKYIIENISGNTLILEPSAIIQEGHYYIVRLTIRQSDRWGTQYLSVLADNITKYIRGDLEPLKQIILMESNYNSSITYFYGQSCMKDDICWICNVDSVTGEWDSTKWKMSVDHTWMRNIIPNTGGLTIRQYIYSKLID